MTPKELLGWILFSLLFWGFGIFGVWLYLHGIAAALALAIAAFAGWAVYIFIFLVLPFLQLQS
ncbi:hypothetical protein AciM339_0213 [Aciduliprofundum sp. MAR08-339]|uniref:hypothetical protein n=1 Tax=Aciduliprofundum sp. (strain MAR08-339) TaxID=673860 RepID=UPI0002A47A78|nr:hypothetical protein AciM339_0181 [Aciduliprofundum sp. MAR08-339]AGB04110.1 hypothetical protein AciM339_0213 [Aciduliprofundum sp. MAR08-339]